MRSSLFILMLLFPAVAFGQEIIISELMKDPRSVGDDDGEWIEVFNASDASVDLDGWEIADNGSDDHVIVGPLVLAPGAYAVLCRNADTMANGDFACDYEYSGFVLANTADEIILCSSSPCVAGVNEVDRVEYTTSGWPNPTGASMVFTGTATADNNLGSNWATSSVREPTYAGPTGDCGGTAEPDCGSPGTKGLLGLLPVELVSFEAALDGDVVTLRWETAGEINNAGFEIQQRAEDGWNVLGWVEGRGTTNTPQGYTFQTERLLPGRHRFRLKQVDYDGAFVYSPEVEVAVAVPAALVFSDVYPNPFIGSATFSLSVARSQRVHVEVFDVRGRRVARLFAGRWPGGTTRALAFEAGALPGGLYLIRAVGEHAAASRAVTVVR